MERIVVGDSRRLAVTSKNINGKPVDPTTLTLRVTKPTAEVLTYLYPTDAVIVKEGIGSYHADFALDTEGTWSYRWIGTGNATFNKSRSFFVNGV